jgi:hypothetical protein
MCAGLGHRRVKRRCGTKRDNLDFPYHPLVYHMDLSIMAYQMHGQSMVWRCGQLQARNTDRTARDGFMKCGNGPTAMGPNRSPTNQGLHLFAVGMLNGF